MNRTRKIFAAAAIAAVSLFATAGVALAGDYSGDKGGDDSGGHHHKHHKKHHDGDDSDNDDSDHSDDCDDSLPILGAIICELEGNAP